MSDKTLRYYNNAAEGDVESRYLRFKNIMKENPLIPIGIIFTGAVLANGARKMRSPEAATMQKMMRYRIYGQGASLALLAYLSFKLHRSYKESLLNDSPDK